MNAVEVFEYMAPRDSAVSLGRRNLSRSITVPQVHADMQGTIST